MPGGGSVSIVLVTRDGMATLPRVLDAITTQEIDLEVEIIAVDSASTDGTASLLADRADRLITVPPEDFDHGLTRNLAIGQAHGDLVVLLVQDAEPAGSRWLEELTTPLRGDPGLAGAFARQQPRPEASRLTRASLARWVAAQEQGWIASVADTDAFKAMTPMQRFMTCVFDNVCSCVRRSVWQEHPFRATGIAEDLEWSREVLLAGHRIAYVPGAVVIHSHERTVRYELGRTFLVHRRLFELFELRTIPTVPALVRSWAVTLRDHLRWLKAPGPARPGAGEVLRALALVWAWPLGQYLGGRAGANGWRLRRLSKI
jgi:rhamnosyltransferase